MSERLSLILEGVRASALIALGFYDSAYLGALRSAERKKLSRICFVCRGNICRSPYAAVKLRNLVQNTPLAEVEITSAGLDTTPDKPADPSAMKVAREHGVNLDDHRTQRAAVADFEKCDLIVVMDRSHVRGIARLDRSLPKKTLLLGSLDPTVTEGAIIPDPYGRSDEDFRECYTRIDRCLDKLVKQLAPNHPPSW